ncbi:hypothetical protein CDL12_15583 [Handroanthus impetiginosus]|uniref:TPX2 central domain-containing protein n=1 Tax=Handroanthus impetiginosus TaxID=429701 RepID=A0A2G9H2U6_9LAMI|nr:hypothetical protein CDL12_15583 [Handroanthus impetiginosus]
MKPTASHLAKLQKVHDKHSGHLCSRFQRTSANLDRKSSQSSIASDNVATKRQKLEIGYLKKIAQLKHQFSLLHKSTKKLTVPKEPELETLLRAQRQRRSKNSCTSSETEKQKEEYNFKAHPLNKKILQGPSFSQPKKSKPQLPEFQVFRLKTMERAKHHTSAKVYPSAADTDVIQDEKQKSPTSKESRLSDKLLESPPIEKFAELSLGQDTKNKSATELDKHASAKGSKKDARNSFQADFWRCHTKPNHCGDNARVREGKCWSNMTRSLGIR